MDSKDTINDNQPTTDLEKATVSTDHQAVDPFLVALDSAEDPKSLPTWRKWAATIVMGSAACCVTSSSSIAAFAELPMAKEYGVPQIVTILSISLVVLGVGVGPLLLGPLSELYGRNIVYRISFALYVLLGLPVIFAPNIAVHLVFRFITALCGSAFLSVSGGSMADMFHNDRISAPMSVMTISPLIGPTIGPVLSGFINQHMYWRWTFRILTLWSFGEFVLLIVFVPETYAPTLLGRKVARLQKQTNESRYHSGNDQFARRRSSLLTTIIYSCSTPFKLMYYERMVLFLNLWNSLMLGIVYLAFQAFPIVFLKGRGFSVQSTGLTFIGLGVGMTLGLASQPFWNRYFARAAANNNGVIPPETRLAPGKISAILGPIGLFWMAFTFYPQVHWIVPIIASVFFGASVFFSFVSVFTYVVASYRPVAASGVASNAFMRGVFSAALPLATSSMYNKMGTVGATAFLAGLCTLLAPLPFIFSKYGERIRKGSKFAVA